MSGRKNKSRKKSGVLTGVVIISTGLIAGYHGLELALPEQGDQIVTASLNTNDRSFSGRDGLANLIQDANYVAVEADQNTLPVARDMETYPVVNRVLKRDRDRVEIVAPEPVAPPIVTPPIPVSITPSAPLATAKELAGYDAEQPAPVALAPPRVNEKPVRAPQVPVLQASLASEVPYADSADIALFAADMPLPAKLTQGRQVIPGAIVARSYAAPTGRSPLVPRKFVSGKAFGGLAERAFQKRERRCMTTALYFEARSEPESGQIAVGQTVMNRVRSPDYPDTICGVVYQGSHRRTGCQFSFTCDGKADKPSNKAQWKRSKRLANDVLEGKVWLKSIGTATHYHATYVKPRWRRKMLRLKQIGRHIFYKSPNISVTDTYQRYTSGQRS